MTDVVTKTKDEEEKDNGNFTCWDHHLLVTAPMSARTNNHLETQPLRLCPCSEQEKSVCEEDLGWWGRTS